MKSRWRLTTHKNITLSKQESSVSEQNVKKVKEFDEENIEETK